MTFNLVKVCPYGNIMTCLPSRNIKPPLPLAGQRLWETDSHILAWIVVGPQWPLWFINIHPLIFRWLTDVQSTFPGIPVGLSFSVEKEIQIQNMMQLSMIKIIVTILLLTSHSEINGNKYHINEVMFLINLELIANENIWLCIRSWRFEVPQASSRMWQGKIVCANKGMGCFIIDKRNGWLWYLTSS